MSAPFPPDFPAQAEIDLTAVATNVRSLREHAPGAEVMAVVKADAYGHGLIPCALAALAGGATWLGTAQLAEALALRAAGIGSDRARLLAWLYAPGAALRECIEADIDLSVAAPWALAEAADAARAAGRTARVHIKVDTGLGRGGVMPGELPALLDAALAAEAEGAVRLVGLWSHMAFADEPGHPTVLRQAAVFDEAIGLAARRGARLEVRHLANSAATLTDPAVHYDLVRPGLAVYGLSPVPRVGGPSAFGLTPAMTLRARLATVKRVPAGHGVSYGHQYVTPRDTVLGVVPIGYADGVPRHASSGPGAGTGGGVPAAAGPGTPGGPVAVGSGPAERVLRVAGRVCMDQFVLDLGPDAGEQAGDPVTLFGPGAGAGAGAAPNAEDWAVAAGTISYEITTRLGARVPRSYAGADALGLKESAWS